jgi:protein ImuA
VVQQVSTPKSPAAGAASVSPEPCPRPRISSVGAGSVRRSRICPDAAPVSRLEGLRAQVRAIEKPVIRLAGCAPQPSGEGAVPVGRAVHTMASTWTLGVDHLDTALAGDSAAPGLECSGVHEIKARLGSQVCAASARAAALGFALRLAVRRLSCVVSHPEAGSHGARPTLVWCAPSAIAGEAGRLHGPGLIDLGLDPAHLLWVETARPSETLWAMEEALRSGAVSLVIGVLDAVDLTAARRLSLAAQASSTPCLLVSGGHTPASAATASRWRVGLTPSPPDPLDPGAPGGFAVSVEIERCRHNPGLAQSRPFALEWCYDTHRFRGPAVLADRAYEDGILWPPGIEKRQCA